jgi:Kdo2-lipid IVA lauroyltransferase/acyltransferase
MTWLWIGVLRLLHALLPIPALAWLGEAFGSLLHVLAGARRRVVSTNLRLCFPELSEAERAALARAHLRALGRSMLLETVSWWGSRAQLERLVRFEGLEHVRVHSGKPLIWLAPHFVGLNIGGVRVTAEFAPIVSLYARLKNAAFDKVLLHSRTRFGASEMYSRQDGIKPVIRAIKSGKPFYYLPDMDYGRKESIFVPFFCVPTATITGLSRLARATGAAVVPCVTRWENGGYITRFYPAWANYPTDDAEADTRRMNAWLEDRIREHPEQYFWVHRRFKTRPEGEKGFYDA